MSTCPDGHRSATTDYCSVCGMSLGGAHEPERVPGTESTPEPDTPVGGGTSCPSCSAVRGTQDVFCESCGFDFLTGSGPEPVPAPPREGSGDPLRSEVGGSDPGVGLVAVISADRDHFERTAGGGDLRYPVPEPALVRVELRGDALIGRRSESRGIYPELDITSATGDPAVSSRHALIRVRPDGSAVLLDVGSTNGTFLDGASEPVAAGRELALGAGSIIRVGAWTRIVVEEA